MRMKRSLAPMFWPISRKQKKFIVSPSLGTHPKYDCIPLAIALRDILKYAQTMKEVKLILNKDMIKVDNKVRKDYAFPLGLMDVLAVGGDNYRILPSRKGICLQKIDGHETSMKLLQVRNKTCLAKNKMQLNMHDGRNVLVSGGDYKTGDTVIFDLEKGEIRQTLKMKKDSVVIVTGGHNIGSVGKIDEVVITKTRETNYAIVRIGDKKVTIPKNYIFVVGEDKPVIRLGGE